MPRQHPSVHHGMRVFDGLPGGHITLHLAWGHRLRVVTRLIYMLSLLNCSTLPTARGSLEEGKNMPLSQSSKQDLTVLYLRS